MLGMVGTTWAGLCAGVQLWGDLVADPGKEAAL